MRSSDFGPDQVIPHPSFTNASAELESGLLRATPGTVIFLVGASGSGKTWIRRTVARKLYGLTDKWPPGKVPYTEVMSLLADRGYFSTKDLAVTLFEQINAPDIDWLYKEPATSPAPYHELERCIARIADEWKKEKSLRTEREAWRAIISTGMARQLQVAAIEHASLMVQNRVDGNAKQHTLNLMSMATKMGSCVLLTTTPDGCELWTGYPEINRRAIHVFVRPYDLKCTVDRKNFAVLVKALSKGFKFEPKDLPLRLLAALGYATQTAPGVVRKIFEGAHSAARARGSEVITRKDLQGAFPSPLEVDSLVKSVVLLKGLMSPFSHPSFADSEDERA